MFLVDKCFAVVSITTKGAKELDTLIESTLSTHCPECHLATVRICPLAFS